MPGSLTTPGRPGARADAPGCIAFHNMHGVGTRDRTLSRLNGWPMRSPVNASPRPSRTTAHDSGPMWIAIPSSQGTCTLYSSPVSRRFAYSVRFTPMCGRLRVGKDFLHSQAGRCSHVFGLLVRFTRPLAIMPSADQVPVKSPHSTMLGGSWVVLIAGIDRLCITCCSPSQPSHHAGCPARSRYAASATGSL